MSDLDVFIEEEKRRDPAFAEQFDEGYTRFKLGVQSVRYDNSLEQYNKTVLFPRKLALANEMLAKYGIPQEVQAAQHLPESPKTPNTQG